MNIKKILTKFGLLCAFWLLLASCEKTPEKPAISETESIKIYAPIAKSMLISKDDLTEYSTVNLFDDDPATIYAVDYLTLDKKGWLLEIRFSEPAVFDTLSVKGGYFDKNRFKKNERIKDLSIEIWNCRNKDYEKSLVLKNKMEEQTLYSGEKIIATKIRINVDSIYSSKSGYLVISDLNFYLGGKRLPVYFGKGKCIFGEDFTWYKYDEQGRLSEKMHQAGHAGGHTENYKYEDGKTFVQAISWEEDDDFEPEFVEVKTEQKKGMEFFKSGEKIVAEKYTESYDNSFYINQYFYGNKGELGCLVRICENSNWANDFTEFVYNENGQLIEKIGYEDATIYNERYTE